MTEERAIFQGTFADFKVIKTRKVAQFVIETPIEQADFALKALGGVPRSDKEAWVVVARLDPKHVQKPEQALEPEKPKARASLTRQAAIACTDPRFQAWLTEHHSDAFDDDEFKISEEWTAGLVRLVCQVESRAEFDTDPEAAERWKKLYGEYLAEAHL